VHDRVTKNETDIKAIFEDLDNVKNMIKKLRKYTDKEIKEFKDHVATEKEAQDKTNQDHKDMLNDHKKQLGQHLEVLADLGKKCKDSRTYCDKLQEKSDKAFKKIDDGRNEMF
jgi:DNA-binding transcriptional MerR regulator